MRAYIFFCVWISCACAQNLEESLFLRRIADFWEEGEYTIAKHQMGEFLNTFAESSYSDTLRMTLGDLFLREKNFSEAMNCYGQISNQAVRAKVFPKRMQCLYHLQWYATLADECEAFLQKNPEPSEEKLEATYLLALALYEQCSHPASPETPVQQIAERAKPYFEILSNSPLSNEVASAFVHLRCLLNDFAGAAQIYLDLAKEAEHPEELLFQAALLQSKYDKAKSLQTFHEIAELKGSLESEAAYNRLVISFDLGKYQEIIQEQDLLFETAPEDKKAFAQLLVSQSFLALKEYKRAALAFEAFLQAEPSPESLHAAFQQIIEVSYRTNDLALLDLSIEKMTHYDAEDSYLGVGSFTRAQILKKEGKLEEAKREISTLLTRYPHFKNRPEALFNLIQIESSAERFTASREAALFFLKECPDHELSSSAWRHLLYASTVLAEESKEWTSQLIQDLEAMLAKCNALSETEQLDFQFQLAKAYFDIGAIQEALNFLEPICKLQTPFDAKGNAELLLALCCEDDLPQYCEWAEWALEHKATLLPEADQHLRLFNAYLVCQPEATELLARHLTVAFELQAKIAVPNLLWLADVSKDTSFRLKIAKHLLAREDVNPKNIGPDTLFLEPFLLSYAQWLQENHQAEESIEWLSLLNTQYQTAKELDWRLERDVKFSLAEAFLAAGKSESAEELFDELTPSVRLHDRLAASAALQSARIKQTLPNKDPTQILSMLKNISLQKTLNHEPIHLEAALDYIDLLASLQPPENQLEKKLDLLLKTKANFEAQEDILSKDYHAARNSNAEKNLVYNHYMVYLEAQIFLTRAQIETREEEQKELQANAKELLLQIKDNTCLELKKRLETEA